MNQTIYKTPSSNLEKYEREPANNWFKAVLVISAIFSIHYLAIDARYWLEPKPYLGGFQIIQEWLSRIFYALPKLGVFIAAISSFKFMNKVVFLLVGSWLFAIAHSVVFYGSNTVIFTEIEYIRLVIHHVIPHLFFLFLILYVFKINKLTKSSSKDALRVWAP